MAFLQKLVKTPAHLVDTVFSPVQKVASKGFEPVEKIINPPFRTLSNTLGGVVPGLPKGTIEKALIASGISAAILVSGGAAVPIIAETGLSVAGPGTAKLTALISKIGSISALASTFGDVKDLIVGSKGKDTKVEDRLQSLANIVGKLGKIEGYDEKQFKKYGEDFEKVAKGVGTFRQVKDTLDKFINQNKDTQGKISDITGALDELEKIQMSDNTILRNIRAGIDKYGNQLGGLQKVQKILIDNDIAEQNHNEQLLSQVKENGLELDAIREQEAVIPDALEAVEEEIGGLQTILGNLVKQELNIDDALIQIKTRIDKPQNHIDMIDDLQDFNDAEDMLEYMRENLSLLNQLNIEDRNKVLDFLIDNNAYGALHRQANTLHR